MALFPKPDENNDNQEILSQLVTRLNDVDRRLRIVEQAISNQKLNINNLNENLINNRKDTERQIGTYDKKLEAFTAKISEVEAAVQAIREEMKKLPTTSELAEFRTKSLLDSEIEKGDSNLDLALDTLEKHGSSLKEELE